MRRMLDLPQEDGYYWIKSVTSGAIDIVQIMDGTILFMADETSSSKLREYADTFLWMGPIRPNEETDEFKESFKKLSAVKCIVTWRDLFEAFPPLDPASEFYDQPVSGAEVVQFISGQAKYIREALDVLIEKTSGKED